MKQQKHFIPIITACAILLIVTSPACGSKAKSEPSPLITPSATVSGEGTLIFWSNRDGNDEIYRVQADGTGLTNLTNNPSNDRYHVWSPDGKQIAFYSDRGGHWELYVMNADGSNPRRLYGFGHPVWPAWSPDAKWIALSSDLIINVDGSGARPVAAGNGEPCKRPAVWSPDGTQFACETNYGSGTAIAVRHVDLGQTTYLTGRRFNEVPVWSPDGARIAFRSWDTGFARSGDIYTANPDGSGVTRLSGYKDSKVPAWSPDGTKIANITRQCTGLLECGSFEIRVMNADGTGKIQLTYNDLEEGGLAWSPDSTRIAFSTTEAIYIINADGSAQMQLVAPDGRNGKLSWQPTAPYMEPVTPTPGILADTFFGGCAYLDSNSNGAIDPDDQPVEDAVFVVTLREGIGFGGSTTASGCATVVVPGGLSEESWPVTVRMAPPEETSYELVGSAQVVLNYPNRDADFLFANPPASE